MPHKGGQRIRNVAIVGHRGSGKTSLNEALLFEAGAINRLGSVMDGSTVSDSEPDEVERQMSISASLASFEHDDRKINLIDTPGEPSFVADTLAALRVSDSAVFVVNGVMGVEVSTDRLWRRAEQLGLARLIFVNMLDRERADFFRSLEALKEAFGPHAVATEIPIGEEHETRGIVDLVDMKAYEYGDVDRSSAKEIEIPGEIADRAESYREKLMDEVAENSDELMERYLEGEEISHDEIVQALKDGVTQGTIFPVTCGIATKNLGTDRLLDALVNDLPSPVRKGPVAARDGDGNEVEVAPEEDGDPLAYVFKTLADPFAGRINLFRVLAGTLNSDSTVVNARSRSKERVGQLLELQGKDHEQTKEFGAGDIGAVAKLKETTTGDLLLDAEHDIEPPKLDFPEPVMSFAVTPKAKGDEEKVGTSLRRLSEEDPTLMLRRDAQTGEQLLSGMSQMHVEVAVDRLKSRFGVEVDLHQPRVPYLETIRKESRARHRYKKQTGGRGQFGDCEIVLEPLPERSGYEFVDEIVGGVIAQSFRPAVDKGIQEAMQHGELAGAPVQGVRVRLVDGQQHQVDSSEMAFKIAGSMAFKDAYAKADPVLLEPIMEVEVSVHDDAVGSVNGDLNSRRGRLQGMEPHAGMTRIKAEVPMAEILTYSQALTSLTGGRGDYHMHFLRYEEVPTHIAQKVIAESQKEPEEAKV